MTESRYNIVFRGELVGGADAAVVKQNLAKVFKMDAGRVEKLFTGKPVVLKKDADKATAMKFRAVLKKAGAQCEMKPLEGPELALVPAEESTAQKERASFAARDPDTQPLSEQAAQAERQRQAEAQQAREEADAESSRADEEQQPGGYPEVEEIEAAPPPGAPSADAGPSPEARSADAGPPPDSDLVGTIRMGGTGFSKEFDVAPAGAEMGEERKTGNEVNPDISHLSMAPPGADLEQLPSGKKVEVPDISHLQVVVPEDSDKKDGDSGQ